MLGLWKKKTQCIDIEALLKKAKSNDINAQYELSLAYYRGLYVPKNIKKSHYWFDRANECEKEGVKI